MSQRRSIAPCGIDDSDPEALRAHDAIFYRQDSAVSDTDSDDETLRAGKRADRGCEDNDEVFSDVDFPTNTGTGSAVKPELATVLDKIQALLTTACSSAMNHYLQFGDGQLVSLFSSLGFCKRRQKSSSYWVSWQRLCRVFRLRKLAQIHILYSWFGHKIYRKSFLAIPNTSQLTLRSLQDQVDTPGPS